MYHNIEDGGNDAERKVWTELGFRHNFKLREVTNDVMIFGTFGDEEGLGVQTHHCYNGHSLTLNAERAFEDGRDPTRLGFDINLKVIDKLSFGGAIDVVRNANEQGDTNNFYLSRILIDPTDKDVIGIAHLLSDVGGERTHSGILTYTHNRDSWGTRSWARYDHSPGARSFTFDSIWVQNPNTPRGWALVPVSRSWGCDPILNYAQVTGNAIDFESPNVPGGFSDGGWVGRINTNYSEFREESTGRARIDGGYVFNLGNSTLGVVPYFERFFGRGNKGSGCGMDVTLCGPDLFLQTTLRHSKLKDTEDTGFYVYLGKSFP